MPTENPKISAYVPQAVYNRFKQFQEERKLSMSQAATELIAEYFGINLKEETTSQSTSSLPERVTQVEKEIEKLRNLYAHLMSAIEVKESTSSLLSKLSGESHNLIELQDANIKVEEESTELPSSLVSKPFNQEGILTHIQTELIPLSNNEIQLQESSSERELPSNEDIRIDHKLFCQRLGTEEKETQNRRRGNIEKFRQWSSTHDKDNISWSFAKDGNKVYYYPYSSLTSELKSSLLNWIDEHINAK